MCNDKIHKKSKIQKAKDDLRESCDKLKKSVNEGEGLFCEIINQLWKTVEVEKQNRP